MKSLAERERILSHIYNNTSDIMFLLKVEARDRFVYDSVNQKFLKFTGVNEKLCIGKKFEEAFPHNISDKLLASFDFVYLNKKSFKTEISISIKGSVRHFDVEVIPLSNDENECQYILVIAQDLTGWKTREEELIKLKRQAEESNRLKTALLANLNHEIRTPLHGILGLAEIMRDELILEEHKKITDDIRKAGKRLLNTLHSIIELSTLEAEQRNVNYAKISISEILSEVFEKYSHDAEAKGLYFQIENKCPQLKLHIDKLLLTEILGHLLDNAIKFTTSGGIKLEVENVIENSESFAIIKIEDTGIGISKENIQNIFNEFRQESEGHGRYFEGMGLGLSLVKKMTSLMNGNVYVESEKNKGSIFTIKFHAALDTARYHEEKKVQQYTNANYAPNENMPRALLVEDNELNSKLTSVFLKNTCHVDYVSDGATAIRKVKEKYYDVILMDINLGGGINGVDAVNVIRKIENYKHIPIVAMTGYALSADKKNFFENGFTHFIAKPFNKHQLLELINEIFALESI